MFLGYLQGHCGRGWPCGSRAITFPACPWLPCALHSKPNCTSHPTDSYLTPFPPQPFAYSPANQVFCCGCFVFVLILFMSMCMGRRGGQKRTLNLMELKKQLISPKEQRLPWLQPPTFVCPTLYTPCGCLLCPKEPQPP